MYTAYWMVVQEESTSKKKIVGLSILSCKPSSMPYSDTCERRGAAKEDETMKSMTNEQLKGFWRDVQEMLAEATGELRDLLLLQRDAIKREALGRGYDCYTIYHW
jgi:hypothetical protein